MAFENLCFTLSEARPEDLQAARKVRVEPVEEKPEPLDISKLFGQIFNEAVNSIVVEAEKLQLAAVEK